MTTSLYGRNARKGPCILLLLALIVTAGMAPVTALAQRKVKLKQADEWQGIQMGDEKVDKLKGHVILIQNQTTIHCDSAYLHKSRNSVEAFGRVKILDGDSVTVTGRHLDYDGNTKIAKLRDNVVFTKLGTATLYTDYLDYDRPGNMAWYYDGGKLVDSINVLTSRKGYYNVNTNMASFKKDVHVKNPDYTMTSDSLQYNSRIKVIYFRTSTTVVNNKGETFIYEGGNYDTRTKQSDLEMGIAETPSYMLEGEDYRLDDVKKFYKVRKNVVMTSKKENMIIYGQAVDYDKRNEITTVYNDAWLAKVTDDGDTLFIAADTLVSIDNPDPAKKRLLAYHNVRIYKKDMQGVADSLVYVAADSIIYFYKDPVLWNRGNQMTADSISMLIEHNNISKIFMDKNAFVVSQDTLFNFNQIKGRNMTAEFAGGALDRVLVEGNGESIYYALEEEDLSFTGMNRIICSNILIRFKQGRVDKLSFYVQPDASFIPPHMLTEEDERLKGFAWKGDVRPEKKDVIPEKQTPPAGQSIKPYQPATP